MLSTVHPPNDDVPPDVWRTRLWVLLHHAGFLTYPHHDANGLMTYILPEDGWKFWAIMAPKHLTGSESREQLTKLFEESIFTDPDAESDSESESTKEIEAGRKRPKTGEQGGNKRGQKRPKTDERSKQDEAPPSPPKTPPYHTKADVYVIFARPGDLV